MTTDTMTNNESVETKTRKFKLTYMAIPSIIILMAAGYTYMTINTTNLTQNQLLSGYATEQSVNPIQNNSIHA